MNTIASFFAGIMAFIGSLFGQPVQVPVQTTVNQPVEQIMGSAPENTQVEATSSSVTASTSSKLKIYRSDLFGYEIQYPETWMLQQEEKGIFLYKNKESALEFAVYVSNFDKNKKSLKEWFLSEPYPFNDGFTAFINDKSMEFKSGERDGNEILELISKGCKENTLVLRKDLGLVFEFVYYGRDGNMTNPCLTSAEAERIGESFVFKGPSLRNSETNEFISLLTGELGLASGVTQEAIEKDFEEGISDNFYETKSKIFFYVPNEKGGCNSFYVLDKNAKRYYATNLSACPDVSLNETLPYYIKVPNLDYDIASTYNASSGIKNIHVIHSINLENGKEKEILRLKDEESFIAHYSEYGGAYMSYKVKEKSFITINIYKKYTTLEEVNNLPKRDWAPVHEKIREEVINYAH
jgi:hypothetical protein